MNLILYGMMGVGKTTVGALLAKRMGRRWVDTDHIIEEKYGDIAELFHRFGEEYFRRLETETVQTLAKQDGLVISVGGGLVLCEENVSLFKRNGVFVHLCASAQTLQERLTANPSRPLLQTGNVKERLQDLLKARTSVYEKIADFTVDTDGKRAEETAKEILFLTSENW